MLCLVTDIPKIHGNLKHLGWPFIGTKVVRPTIKHSSCLFFSCDSVGGYFQLSVRDEDSNLFAFLSKWSNPDANGESSTSGVTG